MTSVPAETRFAYQLADVVLILVVPGQGGGRCARLRPLTLFPTSSFSGRRDLGETTRTPVVTESTCLGLILGRFPRRFWRLRSPASCPHSVFHPPTVPPFQRRAGSTAAFFPNPLIPLISVQRFQPRARALSGWETFPPRLGAGGVDVEKFSDFSRCLAACRKELVPPRRV